MSMDVKNKVALAVGAALLSAACAYKVYMKSSQQRQGKHSRHLVKGWKEVGKVTALHIFPIKSCQGIEVNEAQAEAMGLVNGELQDRFVHLVYTIFIV